MTTIYFNHFLTDNNLFCDDIIQLSSFDFWNIFIKGHQFIWLKSIFLERLASESYFIPTTHGVSHRFILFENLKFSGEKIVHFKNLAKSWFSQRYSILYIVGITQASWFHVYNYQTNVWYRDIHADIEKIIMIQNKGLLTMFFSVNRSIFQIFWDYDVRPCLHFFFSDNLQIFQYHVHVVP